MKRLSLLFTLACTLCVCAEADAYRDSLQIALQYSQSQSLTALSTMIVAPKVNELWGKSITYAYGQFMSSPHRMQMLVDIYEPACRERLSLGDMTALLQWIRSSKVLVFCRDQQQIQQAMRAESITYFVQGNREKLKQVPAKAKKGKTVKIQTMSIPKAYRETCKLCFEKLGITDTVLDAILVPVMLQSLGGLTPEEEKLPEVHQFAHAFTVELLAGCFYEKLRIGDLQYCINGTDSPYYKNYEAALQYASSQTMLVTTEFLGAFASYINTYHPHLVSTLNQCILPH